MLTVPVWNCSVQDGGISKVGTVVGTRRLDGSCPPDGDNPSRGGWTKVSAVDLNRLVYVP